MGWVIGTYKKEYENLKQQIEEYQDFWEWYEAKYGKTKAGLFDEWNDTSESQKDTTSQSNCLLSDVSGSINNMLDTIHDNLINKGFDCFNADDSAKEVDEYKLTFKDVREELAKYYR